jgi:hypothetical protein
MLVEMKISMFKTAVCQLLSDLSAVFVSGTVLGVFFFLAA